MMKTLYTLAWILVALAAAVSLLMGYFNAITLVVFSLLVVSLVYALALWSVITNTRGNEIEIFSRNNELNFKGGKQ